MDDQDRNTTQDAAQRTTQSLSTSPTVPSPPSGYFRRRSMSKFPRCPRAVLGECHCDPCNCKKRCSCIDGQALSQPSQCDGNSSEISYETLPNEESGDAAGSDSHAAEAEVAHHGLDGGDSCAAPAGQAAARHSSVPDDRSSSQHNLGGGKAVSRDQEHGRPASSPAGEQAVCNRSFWSRFSQRLPPSDLEAGLSSPPPAESTQNGAGPSGYSSFPPVAEPQAEEEAGPTAGLLSGHSGEAAGPGTPIADQPPANAPMQAGQQQQQQQPNGNPAGGSGAGGQGTQNTTFGCLWSCLDCGLTRWLCRQLRWLMHPRQLFWILFGCVMICFGVMLFNLPPWR